MEVVGQHLQMWMLKSIEMPSRPSAPFLNRRAVAAAWVTSAYGRVGNVVGAEGDYVLNQMGDVDTATTPPTNDAFLSWDGTTWVATGDVEGGIYL